VTLVALQVLMEINARKVANKHIVIGCTVIPGYIEETGKFLIQDCTNTSLSYHPEFIAQGDIMNGTLNPDMALIGEGSKAAGDVLEEMNLRMTIKKPVICRMSPASAEITKLSINCYVTMKVLLHAPLSLLSRRSPLVTLCRCRMPT
jgi:UDP-glucose 6-dehydrogenase